MGDVPLSHVAFSPAVPHLQPHTRHDLISHPHVHSMVLTSPVAGTGRSAARHCRNDWPNTKAHPRGILTPVPRPQFPIMDVLAMYVFGVFGLQRYAKARLERLPWCTAESILVIRSADADVPFYLRHRYLASQETGIYGRSGTTRRRRHRSNPRTFPQAPSTVRTRNSLS